MAFKNDVFMMESKVFVRVGLSSEYESVMSLSAISEEIGWIIFLG